MINNKTIYHIVTTSGENYNSVYLNWHSDKNNSYVLLKEADDSNFKKMKPTSAIYWDTKNTFNANSEDSFYINTRYVCYLHLTDLSDNTIYEYKIVNDDEESDTYSFKITSDTSLKFLAFSDLQNPGNLVTHNLMNKLSELCPDANLMVCSGDLTGTAANESEWTWLLDNSINPFKDKIFSSSVGDHEYWGKDVGRGIPMMNIPDTYNHIFRNPQNGPINYLNSSYYFIKSRVLFIFLNMGDSNTIKGPIFEEQILWFNDTINALKEQYDFLIILAHKSLYGSTLIDPGVAKYIKPVWTKVFDNANVDLVISGHDHLYSRTKQLYQDQVSNNSSKGCFYLDLGSSGNKRRNLDGTTDDNLHECIIDINGLNIAVGATCEVENDSLIVKIYDQEGILRDHFRINKKF